MPARRLVFVPPSLLHPRPIQGEYAAATDLNVYLRSRAALTETGHGSPLSGTSSICGMLTSRVGSDNIYLDVVSSEINRLSGFRFRRLLFPRGLETLFEESSCPGRSKRLWFEGLLANILFDFYLYIDYWISPQHDGHALLLRLFLITPLSLLVNAAMLWKPGPVFRESSVAFVACLAGATELYLQGNHTRATSAYAQFGVTAVLVFANTVMRLRFRFALGASILVSGLDVVFLRLDHILSSSEKEIGLCLTMCTLVLTVLANYSQNREERLNFLFCLRGDLLIKDLHRANADLAIAADTDALTGLANRHAFHRKLDEYWPQMLRSDSLLSVILIDVDHFKAINDTFGHLYGDTVLKRIARLIQESTRGSRDFVARFGGEEFVMLLPETTEEEALSVADRLRQLIEAADAPALEIPGGRLRLVRTTVSCGVASSSPMRIDHSASLLEMADRALYQAKEQGRNRICLAYGTEPQTPRPESPHPARLPDSIAAAARQMNWPNGISWN